MPTLRDYQAKGLSDIRASFAQGYRAPLYVLPTGGGKGIMIPEIVRGCVQQGKRVVFLVSRRALVQDMSKRLQRVGVNHGLYLGSSTRMTHLPCAVASIDTMSSRSKSGRLPKFDLAIIDEARMSISDSWLRVVDDIGRPPLIGFDATPERLDGKGLGLLFDCMITGPGIGELIEKRCLVPTRVFAPSIPDLTGVKTLGGDFSSEDLEAVMSQSRLIGDTVEHWMRINEGQATIGFAVNRRHGRLETAAFNAAGVRAEFLDGETPDREREATWSRLRRGDTKVVWTVMIASYGFDEPCIKHGIFSRPTKSVALWLQQAGRIIRPFENHQYAIIQDHSGNIMRPGLGFIEEPREWTLDDRKRGKSRDEIMPIDKLPQVCPKCKRVARPGERSCSCGYAFAFTERKEVERVEGNLVELKERPVFGDAAYGASDDPAVQAIINLAKVKGWRPGAIYFRRQALAQARDKYREFTGSEPKNSWSAAAIESILDKKMLTSA